MCIFPIVDQQAINFAKECRTLNVFLLCFFIFQGQKTGTTIEMNIAAKITAKLTNSFAIARLSSMLFRSSLPSSMVGIVVGFEVVSIAVVVVASVVMVVRLVVVVILRCFLVVVVVVVRHFQNHLYGPLLHPSQ
jgi:hypothetical protein